MRDAGEDETEEYIRISYAYLFLALEDDDPERAAYFADCQDEDLALYDIWGKMLNCEGESTEYARLLSELLDCETLDGIRLLCVLNESENILKYHNDFAPEILKKLTDVEEGESFIKNAETVYSDLMELQYGNMKKDPMNPKVQERLEYYMNAVEVLTMACSPTVGYIAGDIAPILRMRGEYGLALKYHEIASKAYLDAKNGKEYFVERINMALTYKEAGDIEQSADILFDILNDSEFSIDDYPRQKAVVYGHIAEVIQLNMDQDEEPDPEMEEFLIQCFELEESYFRSVNEPYDIAVSLINQLHYYSRKPEEHRVKILLKFRETEKIATDNSLGNILYYLKLYKETVLEKIL